MGDIISLGDSIIITIFSMAVVFLGLIVLAMLISVLKSIGKEKNIVAKEPVVPDKSKETMVDKIEETAINDEELVAVIAAAIAASLGVSIPEVNIKSIRRVPQNTPAWASAGRQEQIFGKL